MSVEYDDEPSKPWMCRCPRAAVIQRAPASDGLGPPLVGPWVCAVCRTPVTSAAPLREGHALGLLEELREALRVMVQLQYMATPEEAAEAGSNARNVLAKADAPSPVGELRTWRTWQEERNDVVADLRRLAKEYEEAAKDGDMPVPDLYARAVKWARDVVRRLEQGMHVGASQETAEKEAP